MGSTCYAGHSFKRVAVRLDHELLGRGFRMQPIERPSKSVRVHVPTSVRVTIISKLISGRPRRAASARYKLTREVLILLDLPD